MCNKYGGEMRMAFDKMDWHAVTFTDSIPYENAGTHIGMYLAWLVNNDLIQMTGGKNSQMRLNVCAAGK